MKRISRTGSVLVSGALAALLAGPVMAGGHSNKQIGVYSGFEGNEKELGMVIVEALKTIENNKGEVHDYSGMELDIGLATSKMIKTFESNTAYQHYMNDALVKMTLEFIQYAKDQGELEKVAREDAMTQFPMLKRIGAMIEKTGKKEMALVAITDQTACFYQLVGEVERGPGYVTYRAPYGHVLEQTRRMGMHDLTEQEIHERWTKPHIEVWSEVLGVEMTITDWQEDGMVTLSIPAITETVAANTP